MRLLSVLRIYDYANFLLRRRFCLFIRWEMSAVLRKFGIKAEKMGAGLENRSNRVSTNKHEFARGTHILQEFFISTNIYIDSVC